MRRDSVERAGPFTLRLHLVLYASGGLSSLCHALPHGDLLHGFPARASGLGDLRRIGLMSITAMLRLLFGGVRT